MQTFEHISFYRFVVIDDPQALKTRLFHCCQELSIKGTVLLASEGINGMLAGSSLALESFLDVLTQDPQFKDIPVKRSDSPQVPFQRLLVKVKDQIITLRGVALKYPFRGAPYVRPETLRSWLEKGEDVVLIDSRNQFETEYGTFRNAISPEMKNFSDWPKFIAARKEQLKGKKIVAFCTGGIRCEKSTAVLLQEGIKEVYQLEGGILEYFAKTDGAFFDGNCFVFDERVAVDKELKPVRTS